MGWGLTTPTAYPAERDDTGFQEQLETDLSKYGYRAYGGEILHIARTILPKGVKVHDSFTWEKRYTDFSHWHLAHERGLVGVDIEDLTQRLDKLSKARGPADLANMLKRPSMAKDWDSHPLELVSRVLPYNSTSIAEIHRHLTALRGGPMHFAFATQHCGLHVHVGLPVPAKYVEIEAKSNPGFQSILLLGRNSADASPSAVIRQEHHHQPSPYRPCST